MWASPEIRAMRRVRQNKELGINSNYDEVYEALKIRDYNDMNRKVDPLKISEGSIVIDTEHMSILENFDALYVHILRIIKDKK